MAVNLIINPGSSSKKYAFYKDEACVLTVRLERTQAGFSSTITKTGQPAKRDGLNEINYQNALAFVLTAAQAENTIANPTDITRGAIRIVAPGTFFTSHLQIDDRYLEELRATAHSAPLHTPPTLVEIEQFCAQCPDIPLYALSDSAFHSQIPDYLSKYSLPFAREHDIKRFGYHGLSVASVCRKAKQNQLELPRKSVVAHIGSGVSVTALLDGISTYNSMGYTPGSGALMGSRASDMDPGALIATLAAEELSGSEAQIYLQQQGGIRGWIGNADLRLLLERKNNQDQLAQTAYQAFMVRLQQEIAAAVATLGGIEILILTATAAERNETIRHDLLTGLAWLGIDYETNAEDIPPHQPITLLTKKDSSVSSYLIPTDEMNEMAKLLEEDFAN